MAGKAEDAHASGFLGTQRSDHWWVPPLIIAVGFTIFIVYSLYAAFVGVNFQVTGDMAAGAGNHLLSPFYSPCLGQGCGGAFELAFLAAIPLSPAFWILWAPLGFRATCYYYRKAYYRSYFLDPAACSVEEDERPYRGETAFPFVLQNLHRYFLPFALLLVVFLSYDAILSFDFSHPGADPSRVGFIPDWFGVSLGTIVLTTNVVLLAGYTFGCHSLRHVMGGKKDCFTCPAGGGRGDGERRETARYKGWKLVTWFNERHMLWAWLSLFWVGFADLFVRLVASGVIHDVRFI